jgi:hypothetical protein
MHNTIYFFGYINYKSNRTNSSIKTNKQIDNLHSLLYLMQQFKWNIHQYNKIHLN